MAWTRSRQAIRRSTMERVRHPATLGPSSRLRWTPRGTAEPAAVPLVHPLSEIRSHTSLALRVCDRLFTIDCACDGTRGLIERVFSAFVSPANAGERPARSYTVI